MQLNSAALPSAPAHDRNAVEKREGEGVLGFGDIILQGARGKSAPERTFECASPASGAKSHLTSEI